MSTIGVRTEILQWRAAVRRDVCVLTSVRCLLSLPWPLRRASDAVHQSGYTVLEKLAWGVQKMG